MHRCLDPRHPRGRGEWATPAPPAPLIAQTPSRIPRCSVTKHRFYDNDIDNLFRPCSDHSCFLSTISTACFQNVVGSSTSLNPGLDSKLNLVHHSTVALSTFPNPQPVNSEIPSPSHFVSVYP